jgi:hypothetical protein
MVATVPQPGSHAFRDPGSQIDLLRPPAVVDCDPGSNECTIVVGVRFVKASRAGAVRVYAGRLHGFVTSESSYWLRSEIGAGWHYKRVKGHCGRVNFLNYRLGRRKAGVHKVVRLRVRVRAAA